MPLSSTAIRTAGHSCAGMSLNLDCAELAKFCGLSLARVPRAGEVSHPHEGTLQASNALL